MLPKAHEELLDAFLQHLRVDRGVSSRTLINYRIDLACFLKYLAKSSKDPLKISREELTEYLWFRKSAGMQPASIGRYMATLRAFYRFLLAEEKISTDPASLLSSPRKAERLPRYLTVEEVSRLMTSVGTSKPRQLRLRAMLELMYAAGLRVGELTGVRMDAIDLKVGYVRVLGKGGKERVVPIGERARLAVQRMIDLPPPAVPARYDLVKARHHVDVELI